MGRFARTRTAAALMAMLVVAPASAADMLAKDLTSTIALLGLPCGQVVNAKKLADNDYIATCKDRNVYRVSVNAQGRVVAQKQ
jgi:BarA-like signal transduction histidine kinase